jgi:3-oxoacyl-(acyl-carrier-protein) synthase
LFTPVSILSVGSISPLGSNESEILESYRNSNSLIQATKIGSQKVWAASLSQKNKQEVENLKLENTKYQNLDLSVLYAILASRTALQNADWENEENIGINIGSSRGATGLFEKYHELFLQNNVSETLSSPTTTLGNISSWVAQDLMSSGPEFSHSITCSTGLQSILNAVAWLKSGMADRFLAGASEAPLTAFTIAQMQAMKIYAPFSEDQLPCKALDLNKKRNSLILGEGASVLALQNGIQKNAIALITGIGYATEILEHNVSLSTDALCFQKSMQMAIGKTPLSEIDAIVMHAPGTVKGDTSELNAIKTIFGNKLPYLSSNKWKIGHTFASSGILSIEMAILMMKHSECFDNPFYQQDKPKQLNKIIINAVGFGGNAVSILIQKC